MKIRDWTTHRLGDVAEVIPSGVDKVSKPEEIPVRLCNYLDVYKNDTIRSDMSFSSATATQAEIDRCRLLKGDVLITKDSETADDIAKPAVVIDDLHGVVCGYHLAIIRPKRQLLSGPYLGHLLRLPSTRKRIAQLANGAIRFGLTTAALNSIELNLPSLAEQCWIADALTTWDRGDQQLTHQLAAKLRYKRWLMLQLLSGEMRLQGRTSGDGTGPAIDPLEEESLVSLEVEFGQTGRSYQEGIPVPGVCPHGWTRHAFGDVFEVIERPAQMADSTTYQLVTAKRYRGGIVPRERLRGDQIKTKTQFFVGKGDFLISKRQIIHGACGLVPDSLDGALVSNEYACLRASSVLDPGFLHYLVHTRYFQQTCFHASVGVALEKMIFRLDQWLKHLVNLPPLEEQWAIARCLSAMDREILLLARQRRLLREQKKGLMQKLLTGQVRVPIQEINQ